MKIAELLQSYKNKSLSLTKHEIVENIQLTLLGEISLYLKFDDTAQETRLITGKEITEQIAIFKANGINRICLHYGYFFNADYQSIIAYTEFLLKNFSGDIYCYSPEELVYLSIISHKDIDQIVADFKKIGIKKMLGFLPKSIIESSYYAEDDELFIDDRHLIFDKLIANGISFDYPFNPSQIESEEELQAVVDFIEKNKITDILVQPNRPIEADQPFNYRSAQQLASDIFSSFSLPLIELQSDFDFYTDRGGYQFYRIIEGQLVAYPYYLENDPRVKIS